MSYLFISIVFILLSIAISIGLYWLHKFVNEKLDDAMSDIAWGKSIIYEVDYQIVRWFKGAEIDRGRQMLAKWEDLCKRIRKMNGFLLISSIILPVFVCFLYLIFYKLICILKKVN